MFWNVIFDKSRFLLNFRPFRFFQTCSRTPKLKFKSVLESVGEDYTYWDENGMEHFWTSSKTRVCCGAGTLLKQCCSLQQAACTTSFDWASDTLSHGWVRLFLKNQKLLQERIELTPIACKSRTQPLCQICSLTFSALFKLNSNNMKRYSKLINKTFYWNKFLTCYLIFNFRPTLFHEN